ncbi:MAG: DUF4434 domain-containing protein, partial [Clostridia bacterium]
GKYRDMKNLTYAKPIVGTWFSIYWYDKRHYYWNEACMKFTAEQWDALIADMASVGLKYIVMCNVISENKCIYDSKLVPKIQMGCDDPMEAVMLAADKYDMHIFMTNDYYLDESFDRVLTPEHTAGRNAIMQEVALRYSHHKSFYGWYWAREAYIGPYFSEDFIKYVNISSEYARKLTPGCKILTAPYGTKNAVNDDKFVDQLKRLDVDIIAYQDTVGCFATDVDGSERAFEILRKAHDRVPQRALWADVETFDWEGKDNIKETPLISAKFERLESQLRAVSPYVDNILVFIFQGLFTNPESIAYTGYKEGARYWNEYQNWFNEHKK